MNEGGLEVGGDDGGTMRGLLSRRFAGGRSRGVMRGGDYAHLPLRRFAGERERCGIGYGAMRGKRDAR